MTSITSPYFSYIYKSAALKERDRTECAHPMGQRTWAVPVPNKSPHHYFAQTWDQRAVFI